MMAEAGETMNEEKFGVYNEERGRMLTGYSGCGVFSTQEEAESLKNKMGGEYDSHLTVVSINPVQNEIEA